MRLGDCVVVDRSFKLSDVADTKVTLRDTFVSPAQNFAGVVVTDDRLYITRYSWYDPSTASPENGWYGTLVANGGLWAIGGIRAGKLSIVSELTGDAERPLAALGPKVALYTQRGLAIYDTSTPSPKLVAEERLRGWGYSSHVLMHPDRATASLGEWGLQTIRCRARTVGGRSAATVAAPPTPAPRIATDVGRDRRDHRPAKSHESRGFRSAIGLVPALLLPPAAPG